ncbi:hypothetical protein ACGFZS_09625 [Streptomyces sp. NPDC048288]|uniref:hypothetical protein n=1 Tax=Streptomyces sp. NPDC048288 TaxID=3365529 RepID=UPI0037225119
MKRRKHHGREQTRNDRSYALVFTVADPARETGESTTSDRRQAYRRARQLARQKRLIRFTVYLGRGQQEDLTASVVQEVEAK